jgi:peptidoglycan/xylan/chitin deacetylase (PgdA/CDA1 family)
MSHPPQLHVATYHYVRDLPRTRFPQIKGMLLDDFRRQAKALPDVYEMATLESAIEFLEGKYTPRRDLCLMTFDDGLREHYADVTPILAEEEIQGLFFLISGCLEDGVVAPVHMNHFLMAHLGFDEYRSAFEMTVQDLGGAAQLQPQTDAAIFQRTYPLDTKEIARFKYVFNFVLAPQVRNLAVKILFAKYLGEERAFGQELYLSWGEAGEMQRAGMIIGGHTHEHRPLATLRYPELFRDLTKNWELIQKNLDPQLIWPFSYPYGKADSFNRSTVEILRQLGYRLALCTEPGNNLPGIDLFAIRRVDCKDILADRILPEVPHFTGIKREPAPSRRKDSAAQVNSGPSPSRQLA